MKIQNVVELRRLHGGTGGEHIIRDYTVCVEGIFYISKLVQLFMFGMIQNTVQTFPILTTAS